MSTKEQQVQEMTNKIRLEVANQKLNDVREQLEMVVKNYKINWYCYIPL